jgi:flavorubredoxin
MGNVIIFYDSKYGNTKVVAEKIAEGLRIEGAKVDLHNLKELRIDSAICAEGILIGAPNHMGRPSGVMKKFIEYLATADLRATHIAVFGTYSGRVRSVDRAVKKLEKIIQTKMPNLKMISSSLSVKVNGVSGPVLEEELPK